MSAWFMVNMDGGAIEGVVISENEPTFLKPPVVAVAEEFMPERVLAAYGWEKSSG